MSPIRFVLKPDPGEIEIEIPVSKEDAKRILKAGKVRGVQLTDRQKRFLKKCEVEGITTYRRER